MDGTPGYGRAALSLQELQRELAVLEAERAELLAESRMFRRLGFSTERITLRLSLINSRRSKLEAAIRQHRAEQARVQRLAETGVA